MTIETNMNNEKPDEDRYENLIVRSDWNGMINGQWKCNVLLRIILNPLLKENSWKWPIESGQWKTLKEDMYIQAQYCVKRK